MYIRNWSDDRKSIKRRSTYTVGKQKVTECIYHNVGMQEKQPW